MLDVYPARLSVCSPALGEPSKGAAELEDIVNFPPVPEEAVRGDLAVAATTVRPAIERRACLSPLAPTRQCVQRTKDGDRQYRGDEYMTCDSSGGGASRKKGLAVESPPCRGVEPRA